MASFLKKAWNYFAVKVFNKVIGRVWKFDDNKPHIIHEQKDKHLINTYYPGVDVPTLNEHNSKDRYLIEQFTEYVYKFDNPVVVEPQLGWVVTGKYSLSKKSFPYIEDPWDKPKAKPSLGKFILPKKVVKIKSCISIRYYWQNYYHFLTDTLAQVYLANEHIPMDVPILVPHVFGKLKYVEQFMRLSNFLSGRKIIVQQPDEYYEVAELYVCKGTFYSDAIIKVVESFGKPVGQKAGGRKLFLTRAPHRGRNISNIAEIEQVVSSFGFEIVDPDNNNLAEQVALFADAAMIIGIHGAGLVNIIFRNGGPLKVLEIFPANTKPAHYRNLSIKFKYDYDSITGSDMEGGSFYLDPEQLREKLATFSTP
jgi:hypothetical protein